MVELLRETIDKYFRILKKTGNRSYCKVDLIIILCFLQELTTKKLRIFLQYRDIHDILNLMNMIMDILCEYFDENEIDFKNYLEGHYWWVNPELWLPQQIYIGDLTRCERCLK